MAHLINLGIIKLVYLRIFKPMILNYYRYSCRLLCNTHGGPKIDISKSVFIDCRTIILLAGRKLHIKLNDM